MSVTTQYNIYITPHIHDNITFSQVMGFTHSQHALLQNLAFSTPLTLIRVYRNFKTGNN